MRYAVNLADLSTFKQRGDIGVEFLVVPVIQSGLTVEINKRRVDGVAVILDCDEERAEAVVAVLRKKLARNVLRCYKSKTGRGGWRPI